MCQREKAGCDQAIPLEKGGSLLTRRAAQQTPPAAKNCRQAEKRPGCGWPNSARYRATELPVKRATPPPKVNQCYLWPVGARSHFVKIVASGARNCAGSRWGLGLNPIGGSIYSNNKVRLRH